MKEMEMEEIRVGEKELEPKDQLAPVVPENINAAALSQAESVNAGDRYKINFYPVDMGKMPFNEETLKHTSDQLKASQEANEELRSINGKLGTEAVERGKKIALLKLDLDNSKKSAEDLRIRLDAERDHANTLGREYGDRVREIDKFMASERKHVEREAELTSIIQLKNRTVSCVEGIKNEMIDKAAVLAREVSCLQGERKELTDQLQAFLEDVGEDCSGVLSLTDVVRFCIDIARGGAPRRLRKLLNELDGNEYEIEDPEKEAVERIHHLNLVLRTNEAVVVVLRKNLAIAEEKERWASGQLRIIGDMIHAQTRVPVDLLDVAKRFEALTAYDVERSAIVVEAKAIQDLINHKMGGSVALGPGLAHEAEMIIAKFKACVKDLEKERDRLLRQTVDLKQEHDSLKTQALAAKEAQAVIGEKLGRGMLIADLPKEVERLIAMSKPAETEKVDYVAYGRELAKLVPWDGKKPIDKLFAPIAKTIHCHPAGETYNGFRNEKMNEFLGHLPRMGKEVKGAKPFTPFAFAMKALLYIVTTLAMATLVLRGRL